MKYEPIIFDFTDELLAEMVSAGIINESTVKLHKSKALLESVKQENTPDRYFLPNGQVVTWEEFRSVYFNYHEFPTRDKVMAHFGLTVDWYLAKGQEADSFSRAASRLVTHWVKSGNREAIELAKEFPNGIPNFQDRKNILLSKQNEEDGHGLEASLDNIHRGKKGDKKKSTRTISMLNGQSVVPGEFYNDISRIPKHRHTGWLKAWERIVKTLNVKKMLGKTWRKTFIMGYSTSNKSGVEVWYNSADSTFSLYDHNGVDLGRPAATLQEATRLFVVFLLQDYESDKEVFTNNKNIVAKSYMNSLNTAIRDDAIEAERVAKLAKNERDKKDKDDIAKANHGVRANIRRQGRADFRQAVQDVVTDLGTDIHKFGANAANAANGWSSASAGDYDYDFDTKTSSRPKGDPSNYSDTNWSGANQTGANYTSSNGVGASPNGSAASSAGSNYRSSSQDTAGASGYHTNYGYTHKDPRYSGASNGSYADNTDTSRPSAGADNGPIKGHNPDEPIIMGGNSTSRQSTYRPPSKPPALPHLPNVKKPSIDGLNDYERQQAIRLYNRYTELKKKTEAAIRDIEQEERKISELERNKDKLGVVGGNELIRRKRGVKDRRRTTLIAVDELQLIIKDIEAVVAAETAFKQKSQQLGKNDEDIEAMLKRKERERSEKINAAEEKYAIEKQAAKAAKAGQYELPIYPPEDKPKKKKPNAKPKKKLDEAFDANTVSDYVYKMDHAAISSHNRDSKTSVDPVIRSDEFKNLYTKTLDQEAVSRRNMAKNSGFTTSAIKTSVIEELISVYEETRAHKQLKQPGIIARRFFGDKKMGYFRRFVNYVKYNRPEGLAMPTDKPVWWDRMAMVLHGVVFRADFVIGFSLRDEINIEVWYVTEPDPANNKVSMSSYYIYDVTAGIIVRSHLPYYRNAIQTVLAKIGVE